MKTNIRRLILKPMTFFISFVLALPAIAQEMGVATAGVNFRSSPNGSIITGIPRGEFFKIKSKKGNWTLVELENGRRGYIYSKYISTKSPDVPESEGGFCASCVAARGGLKNTSEHAEKLIEMMNPVGGPAQCITRSVLNGVKSVWRNNYGGRSRGRGDCARAVRKGLNKAGVWSGGGIGHAKDMIPGLKKMGFKNIIAPGMTPANAPKNTILVYGAASKKNKRFCRGLGSTYGHVEFKENNDSFIYDGKPKFNIQEAYGASCRPLIGVMQMTNSCPTCTKKLKNSCGA